MTGILCPVCGGETSVSETRASDGQVRRRRKCGVPGCGGRVTTIEMPVYGNRHGIKLTGDVVMIPKGAIEHLRAARDYIDRAIRPDGEET